MKKLISLFVILLITDTYVYKQYTNKRIQYKREIKVVPTFQPQPTFTPEPEGTTGLASWYDRRVCTNKTYGQDCKTANGEIYEETKFTTACTSDIKLGSRIRICYMDKCIEVVCNDRGNFENLGRKFDLSRGAFSSLADINTGVIKIKYTLLK